jgi:hypothetical protein
LSAAAKHLICRYAVLAGDADLDVLRQALQLLSPLLAAPQAASTPRTASQQPLPQQQQHARAQAQQQRPARPPREWEAPRERKTQVLCLPCRLLSPPLLEVTDERALM